MYSFKVVDVKAGQFHQRHLDKLSVSPRSETLKTLNITKIVQAFLIISELPKLF